MELDTHQIERALTEYYGTKLRGSENIGISDVKRMEGGIAHGMYSFHLEYVEKAKSHSENLVLRMGGNEEQLNREYQTLEKLNSTSIPVPKVHDMGKDMLGSFLIIMEKVEGQNWEEGGDAGMTESEQEELWRQFATILADIHMLDWESGDFGFLGSPVGEYGFIDQGLSPGREGEGAKYVESHGLTPVFDWLDEHKPPSDHYVLLHGDYHPNNVLVQRGKIVAVVDWEGVSIGDAALDVAEVPLILKLTNTPSEQFDNMVDTFLKQYQDTTERELRNLDYYQILRATGFLFDFLSMPDVDEEWRGTVLEVSPRVIEEMTQLPMPSSLTRR